MANLTQEELQWLRQSVQQESDLIGLFQAAAGATDDPALMGKWQEMAAAHEEHRARLTAFLDREEPA